MIKILIAVLQFILLSTGICIAQVPVYGMSIIFQNEFPPDTLKEIRLYDINHDNIEEIICTTPNALHVFDAVNGNQILDPIELQQDFSYDIRSDTTGLNKIFIAYFVDWIPGISVTFKILSFYLESPDQKDSVFSTIEWNIGTVPYIVTIRPTMLKLIHMGDGAENSRILIFWEYYRQDISGWSKWGYYSAIELSGIPLIVARESGACHKAIDLFYENSQLITISTEGESYSGHYGSYYLTRVMVIDSAFIDTVIYSVETYYAAIDFDILTSNFRNFEMMSFKSGQSLSLYNDPYLSDLNGSHMMPASAIGNFYKFDSTQCYLTGCTNSYFELRDMEMNLLAFIWGPNITISDADPVDIDLDGTDELLCRTANGFILYRLNTSSALDDDLVVIPEEFNISAYPNPFNSNVKLSVGGIGEIPIVITIYNINGQLVRSLLAVNGEANWNAEDDKGQAVTSGLYFTSVQFKNFVRTTKLILLK